MRVAEPPARRRGALSGGVTRSLGLAASLAALGLCILASLAYGSVEMSIGTAIAAFTDFEGSTEHIIVRELRMPRTLIGLGAGAALGLAGALMQGVTRARWRSRSSSASAPARAWPWCSRPSCSG